MAGKTAVLIAAFHTQRLGNFSICLSGQKFLGTIFAVKTKNNVLVKKIKWVNDVGKFAQGSKDWRKI